MGKITSNSVKQGICNKLDEQFDYEIYDEEMKQGFDEPCFFVEEINASQKRIGFRRHRRSQTYCIHFFPEDNETKNQSISEITEKLYLLLEYIQAGGNLCRGTRPNHKAEGGILHFFIDYNYHLIEEVDEDPLMEKLKHKGELKI